VPERGFSLSEVSKRLNMKITAKDGTVVANSPVVGADPFADAIADIGALSASPTGTVPLLEGLPLAEEIVSVEIAICRRYCETGNMALCAREFNRTVYELNKMSRTLWWQEEEVRFKKDSLTVLDATYTRLLDKALMVAIERIEQGEVTGVNKDGTYRRMPVTASVAIRIADSVFIKRQLLRNEPTTIPGDTDRMNILAEKLRALGKKDPTYAIDGAVTEVRPSDDD